ncbi:MAG: HAD hydrolase-like protein, partial [Candidatus Andersenbacteria bacterium]|nr:HAD hydrolase-like protein [Candidatus Andersenbacteria bacterium]
WRKNKIPKRKYWLQVKKDLNLPESISSLEKMWFQQYKPIDEVKNLIDELHPKYKLAYISNNMRERISYLEKNYNFSRWFDDGICSYEVGALKSDIRLYQALLEHFPKIPPNQFLFIDDNEENHTYPEKLGCEFLPFTNIENLRQSLRKKSILPVR